MIEHCSTPTREGILHESLLQQSGRVWCVVACAVTGPLEFGFP